MVEIDGQEYDITRKQLEVLAETNDSAGYIAEAMLAAMERNQGRSMTGTRSAATAD